MLKIKPELKFTSNCPICNTEMTNKDITFTGMRTLISVLCNQCGETYYTDLPSGHGLYYKIFYSIKKKKVYIHGNRGQWFANALKNTVENKLSASITESGIQNRKQLLIISTIDSYYGHALLRVLAYQYYREHYPKMDILMIVQENMKWLLSKSDSIILSVKVHGRKSDNRIEGIDERVKELADQYNEVYIATEYEHIYKQINLEIMTGIPIFDISLLGKGDIPQIGFIWREDRLWIRNNQLYTKLAAIDKHMKTSFSYLLLIQQRKNIILLFKEIIKHIKCKCYITGMGKTLQFPNFIKDMRYTMLSGEDEKELLKLYSNTELIIGLHGSNMLLPSAYAGMTIDLMPVYKWPNYLEDIIFNGNEIRDIMFRYRLLAMGTPIKEIGYLASSMIKDYQHHAGMKMRKQKRI